MASDALVSYVSDHLAGSVAAVELIEVLAEHERGSQLEDKLRALAGEIGNEQETLRQILARFEGGEGRLKQAAAWLTEKVGQARLALVERAHPALARLEGLEGLALGIQGKLALWRTLAELAPHDSRLAGCQFGTLEERATAQHAMIERERMAAARAAFEPGAATGASGT